MPVLCQEYMLFFCLPLSSQPRLRLLRPLSISQHTKRTREGRGDIFDTTSTSGYMGEKYFQEFGPIFFDMSSASGYMGEKYVQEFGPRFCGWKVFSGSWSQFLMGEKYFQEFGPRILTCLQLVGTWVKHIFRNLVPDLWTCPTAKKGHIYKGRVDFCCQTGLHRGGYNYDI